MKIIALSILFTTFVGFSVLYINLYNNNSAKISKDK